MISNRRGLFYRMLFVVIVSLFAIVFGHPYWGMAMLASAAIVSNALLFCVAEDFKELLDSTSHMYSDGSEK